MKRNKIIYWSSTIIITLIMLFSIYKMFSPDYELLGFPDYFRTELVFAKIIGLIVLLIPQIPVRIKEWAYVGFGIVLISASIAHFNIGDGAVSLEPMVFLMILAVSNFYMHKLHQV